jgi:hypothetical protein
MGVMERLRLAVQSRIFVAPSEFLSEKLVLSDVYGGADEVFQPLVFDNRSPDAVNVPNLTIGSHGALGDIEARSVRQDSLDQICHELAILRVDTIQVFLNSRRVGGRIESVNPK